MTPAEIENLPTPKTNVLFDAHVRENNNLTASLVDIPSHLAYAIAERRRDALFQASKLLASHRSLERSLTAAVMALRELLEQVESLAGYELTKDVESYKAEAIWEYVNEQASETLAAIKVAK